MGQIQIETIDGLVPYPVAQTIKRLAQAHNVDSAALATLTRGLKAQPAPLTLSQIQTSLQSNGTTPLNVTNLIGAATGAGIGTHDERLQAAIGPAGSLWYETDRQVFYIVNSAGAWIYGASFPGIGSYVLEGSLFGDLGPNDAGFPAWTIDTGLLYVWSGAVWHVRAGTIIGTFAARPAPFVGVDANVYYQATDRGNQVWRLDFAANAWILVRGWGDPTQGAIAGITGGLTANDAGYRYEATDYARVFEWTGAAYTDAPGSAARYGYVDYQGGTPDLPAGWIPADGTLQTASTSTGATVPFTPNNIAGFFVRV